jgi:hypothetical protein
MQQLVSRTGGDSRTFNKPRFVSEAVLLFLLTALWLGWTLIQPQAAFAHAAVEARHASTIPGWFVLLGAAVALILSFVLLNRYQPASGRADGYSSRRIDTLPFLGWFLQSPAVRRIARILSVALFLLVLAAGFFGHENSDYNVATKLVWAFLVFVLGRKPLGRDQSLADDLSVGLQGRQTQAHPGPALSASPGRLARPSSVHGVHLV